MPMLLQQFELKLAYSKPMCMLNFEFSTLIISRMLFVIVLHCFIYQRPLTDDVCTDMLNLFKHYCAGLLWSLAVMGVKKIAHFIN